MELIKISNKKLKIMLTPTDMCHFQFSDDCFGADSAKMHLAFRRLLAEIRRQTDFEGDDRHLSIQYFPSRGGGCEMFISQLRDEEQATGTVTDSLLPSSKNGEISVPIRRQIGAFHRECAYRFLTLDDILHACARLIGIKSICESHAYRDESGDYLLLLTVLSPSPFSIPEELDFLTEYGKIENAALLRLYIREHATPIASPNAIQTLGRLG